jgi:Putative redox-active protein (C_GCAxxG_C_C)
MSDKVMSRRKFLAGAGAVVGVATVAGLGLANRPDVAQAAVTATPWPYPTDPALQPDPETLARRAYEVYYSSGCAEATWWPIVEHLAKDAANAGTWATLPRNVFKYGGGGVAGWGTLCGTLNGSAAIIAMTGAPTKITDEVMQYYAETPIPTNGIDKAAAGGWTPTPIAPATTIPAPMVNVPTSTAHSQLCHASLSQWTLTTGKADASADQKDRCAKACYDLVLKTVTLMNAWHADHAKVPAGALDASVATCQPACHSSAKGKMACDSCHDNTPDHAMGH